MTVEDTLTKGLLKYFQIAGISANRKAEGAHFKAMRAAGIQLLNWTLNGSSNESRVPPIDTGMLRGSGSVFVESLCVHTSRGEYPAGEPNISYDAGKDSIAVGFNTAYAARLHETTWLPGGRNPSAKKMARNLTNSGMFGDVGNKWLERHLVSDAKATAATYAAVFKRETGA